jgi:hypothetical protein
MVQNPSLDLLLAQLIKKFSKLYVTRRLIIVLIQPDIYPCRIRFFPSYSFEIQFSVVCLLLGLTGSFFFHFLPYMHFSSPPVRATCHVHMTFHD